MEPEPIQTPVPDQFDLWKFIAELVKTAVIVCVLVYVTRTFLLQPFIVEGSSMFPRFETNDYLLVDKLTYRLHDAHRGDIIVFKYPFDTSVNYVKRVIGLPGETVKITNGQVSIINSQNPNGLLLNEPYINGHVQTLLPSGASSAEYKVPDDSYFVMGDNRPASSDSREWSFMPKKDMIGRVIIEAFPFNKASIVTDPTY